LDLRIPKTASANDLAALNVTYNNNLTLGEGASIDIRSGRPIFSLANVRSLPESMGSLIFGGSRDTEDGDRARFSDLDAFNSVSSLAGELWLVGLQFDDLSFLSNVQSVGGSLRLINQDLHPTNAPSGPLDGLENIEAVGGDLEMRNMNVENCYALLPIIGWGDSLPRFGGSLFMYENTPASCNNANIVDLQAEAAPGSFDIAQFGLVSGGVSVYAFKPAENSLFPVTEYEAACRKTNSKSKVSLSGQPFTLPADEMSQLSLSFDKAGIVEDLSIEVAFSSVDRSQLRLAVTAPDYKFSPVLWDNEGDGIKGFVRTFTPLETPTLAGLVGTDASGDWTMSFTPGGTDAALSSFRISLDSLYRNVVSAESVPENYFQVAIPDMPVGDTFQCQLSAINEYGVRSDTVTRQAVTPPPINTTPTVLRVENTNGGVLVYFDPGSYWGTQWFGTVNYVATCDPGSSVTDLSTSSAAVGSSPAFIEGLSADDNLSCYVTIDNLYESVAGPVFAYEPEVSSGLPIWLLYEASRQGE